MRCPSWRWSRRRPANFPYCISSNVHLRFKRLLYGGCTSGSMRGFGCESRAVRWVAVRSRKTVWTCRMCRSEWAIWFETYHGALFIDLRSLDWYLWMTAMLDLEAHPQILFHTSTLVLALFYRREACFPTIGGMFSNESVYLASFEVELLAFRFHVVLPG